ncbi:unnamed protein product [Rotaria sordida]|uniref:Uncharacterized protein n=2 Tax=Rotaria sordida TaxID=392033 RepID=A0A813Z0I3_9BILA|nr:unnamed protein product [Rotaria sordida]CAF0891641.1 unnamed protein product [Rotaria sordida]CAF1133223.1 unnamed protein product [Rotaria sordida]CAF1136508.1 unnamed protein product [Rotaria sordida]
MSYKHNSWSISTQSHFIKSNTFKKRKHVRFGGNCRDPLNLNELIQKSKQSITNNDNIDMNIHVSINIPIFQQYDKIFNQ